ncbi:MAG: carboxypeptidase-like regulatory domain-containing protein [Kofleriaceae bacterium]
MPSGSPRSLPLLALATLTLAACGGDGGDVTPRLITGGGVADPGVDGVVNVYVVDDRSDLALAGATVRVGAVTGTTDAAGLFTAKGDLAGPQQVTVAAAGYATAVWVGVDGANVTVPVARPRTSSATPPHAEIAGTITGWDALPEPAVDHLTGALVPYSQRPTLDADDNDLAPPPSQTQLDANVCVRVRGAATPCAWRANVRTGAVAVFALIVDIDTRGTQPSDDDVVTITGFAKGPTLTVVDSVGQTGIALTPLAASDLITASVALGAPPAGLTQQLGIVGLDLGDAGVIRIPPLGTGAVVIPALAAVGATSYELLASARATATGADGAASVVRRRGLASASSLAAGAWLPPPTGLASNRTTAGFAQVAGAQVHALDFDTPAASGPDTRLMSVLILDATASVTLPVDLTPIPGGTRFTASAVDVGADFDPRDFELDPVKDTLSRLASDTLLLN